MTPQILGRDAGIVRRFWRRPECPRCGDTLLAAATSELVAGSHIRHFWSCETCSHDFMTAVCLSPGPAEEDE